MHILVIKIKVDFFFVGEVGYNIYLFLKNA